MRPHIKRRVEVTTKDADRVKVDVITIKQEREAAQIRASFGYLSECCVYPPHFVNVNVFCGFFCCYIFNCITIIQNKKVGVSLRYESTHL